MELILDFKKVMLVFLVLLFTTSCSKEISLYNVPREVTGEELIEAGFKEKIRGSIYWKDNGKVHCRVYLNENNTLMSQSLTVNSKNFNYIPSHPTKDSSIVEVEGCFFELRNYSIRNGKISFIELNRRLDIK